MQARDLIRIEGLAVDVGVGVYAHEHGIAQRIVVDIALETNIAPAARADDLGAAVDYDRAAAIVRTVAGERHHALIESIAESIASRLLDQLAPRVASVFVRVAKPGAVPDARTVAVEIRREAASSADPP